jgi:V8-like Glu-specific endopeptidase
MKDSTPEQIERNLKAMLRKEKITESDIQLANYWIDKWKELKKWVNEDTHLPKKIKKILT